MSSWTKYIANGSALRAVTIDATRACQELGLLHFLSPQASAGLSEVTLGALMVASYCKGDERINVQTRSSGRCAQAFVDARPNATFRGYAIESESGDARWGEGYLSVLRTRQEEGQQPYVSTVPLVDAQSLVHAFESFWDQSEQIPSAVAFVVESDRLKVNRVWGVLIQSLGDAGDNERERVKACRELLKKVAPAHTSGDTLLKEVFSDLTFSKIEERPLVFECNCSKERVMRALILSSHEGDAEVSCDFCTKLYKISAEELQSSK